MKKKNVQEKSMKAKGLITKVKSAAARVWFAMAASFALFMGCGNYVYAADIASKIKDWAIDDFIVPLGAVAVAVAVIVCASKRAWAAAITTLLGGGLILYLVGHIDTVTKLAENIWLRISG